MVLVVFDHFFTCFFFKVFVMYCFLIIEFSCVIHICDSFLMVGWFWVNRSVGSIGVPMVVASLASLST